MPAQSNGRHDNRYRCKKVNCPIGPVVSISRSGFRVHAPCRLKIKPNQKISVKLQSA